MDFQTVSKQFDKISEHSWKIGLFVLTAIAFWILLFFSNFKNPTPEQTNNLINRSKSLKKIDKMCERLPKPKDFHLVKKIVSGNSNTFAISHYYQSELGYNEVETFYLEWFNQNGWTLETERTLDFRKNNLLIHINKGAWGEANYVIYCAEEN